MSAQIPSAVNLDQFRELRNENLPNGADLVCRAAHIAQESEGLLVQAFQEDVRTSDGVADLSVSWV